TRLSLIRRYRSLRIPSLRPSQSKAFGLAFLFSKKAKDFTACFSFSQKSFALQNLLGSPISFAF
ncbi:MAG: hypothetical protein IKC56_01300, partial [Clostridia bacterium]|nr:hypothetical protein [Clostridia bacterium]